MSGKSKISIVLASASPRRRQLLSKAGYKFIVVKPDVDESAFSAEKNEPCRYAKILALAKAKSVAKRFPEKIVIGADTIVDFHGQIIGKPADAKDAEKIIRKLFSGTHKVITALAIVRLSDNLKIVEADTTIVHPKKMMEKEIAEHIRGRSWFNKAGAYAIQETGDKFVEKIEGSLTNVMGMPMELLEHLLAEIIGKKK